MNKKEIIAKLTEINSIWKLSDDEIMAKYPSIKESDLSVESRYPFISGIIKSEINCLIKRIKGGE